MWRQVHAARLEEARVIVSEEMKLLIVEEERDVAAVIKLLLEKEFPFKAEVAGTCALARQMYRARRFDLVTLDYELPDGSGLELLEEIAGAGDGPPVIIVTGRGDEKTAASALMLGASGYVVKDNRLASILPESVRKALDGVSLKKSMDELPLCQHARGAPRGRGGAQAAKR